MSGFNLSAHRSDPRDRRNGHSTHLIVHKPGWDRKAWRFVPVDRANNLYHIVLAADEKKQDNVDQTGWFLSAHRYQGSDKRNHHSTVVMIHKDGWQAKTWKIVPNGRSYEISLARDEHK